MGDFGALTRKRDRIMETKTVKFLRTSYTGRKIIEVIEVSSSPFDDEGAIVNVPLVNLHREDMASFINALKKASIIAAELERK